MGTFPLVLVVEAVDSLPVFLEGGDGREDGCFEVDEVLAQVGGDVLG